ncbi:MAG TPA: hypothetical protein VHA37_09110 [Candidatus Saccharimonadales bacterium]|nr:hypothetical protein [Candidatus Saccharimonadales bacterium]
MSHEEFTKLFKYMKAFRADVNERFEEVDRQFIDVRGTIAELSADVRDMRHEFMILSHQFDKLRDQVLPGGSS